MTRSLTDIDDVDFALARAFAEQGGFDVSAQGDELKEWCINQAKAGNPKAQHALAKFLSVGLFGETDNHAAYEWCQRAVDAGYVPAIYLLAGITSLGVAGLDANDQLVWDLLKKAASCGYAPAVRALAVMCLTGTGSEIDIESGYTLFKQAAQMGDPYSQLMIGRKLLECEEKVAEAVQWIKASAAQDFPSALRDLGYFYLNGRYGFAVDEHLARQYFDRADSLRK